MNTERLAILQNMPIFGGVREDILEFMLSDAPMRTFRRDEYFFREGDDAHSMFVLESGSAAVVKAWQGGAYLLRKLYAGDCFGEMSLIDFCPRSASVVALADSRAIELTKPNFFRVYRRDLEQFALIQMNMGREVSRRLRATDAMLFKQLAGAEGGFRSFDGA